MGLATVTGMCTKEYGCVIGEIGVLNQVRGYWGGGGGGWGVFTLHSCDKDKGMSSNLRPINILLETISQLSFWK
jgi:hypothetical protein